MSKRESWSRLATDSFGSEYQIETHLVESNDSPREGAVLKLRPCAYRKIQRDVIHYNRPHQESPAPRGTNWRPEWRPSENNPDLTNKALARFNRRLNDGKASLGITIAQWAKSRDMIVQRADKLARYFDGRYQRARRLGRKFKAGDSANAILEGQFGWYPLVADIVTASTTAFTAAIPPLHVSGRASEKFDITIDRAGPGGHRYVTRYIGQRKVCVDAFLTISNPNLWLANRMGVVNPPVVAWDAIPWSWVVGMFVNVGQYLTQFTDELGLRVDKRSVTYTMEYMEQTTIYLDDRPPSTCSVLHRTKTRTVGSIPAVSLRFRMPKLDWNLAVTAASLVTQKVKKFRNLEII